MKDLDSNILIAAVAIILFFAIMFSTIIYNNSKIAECRVAALQRNMSAIEIQAVCR